MSASVEVYEKSGRKIALTRKNGLVRILLKEGKARVRTTAPFTIRMVVDEKQRW